MSYIEKRRTRLEIKRILHFGKIVGPWWRPSLLQGDVNARFFRFLQRQENEQDPILRAAFTCLILEKNRIIVFFPHNGLPYAILRSDRVALNEAEASVAELLNPDYVRPTMPFFSDTLILPNSLRPKTIGKMMIWCVEDTDPLRTIATTREAQEERRHCAAAKAESNH